MLNYLYRFLVEVRLHFTIWVAIDSQFKHKIGALYLHVEFEIEIIELDILRGR